MPKRSPSAGSTRHQLRKQLVDAICARNRSEVVRIVRTDPSIVNAANSHANVPLRDAIETGDLAMVKLLIKHGADPQHRNHGDHSLLDISAFRGQKKIALYLIQVGAQPTVHHTAWLGDVAQLKKAIWANRALLQATPAGGRWLLTPLHSAAEGVNREAVRFLLSVGAEVDAKNHNQHTPLALVPEAADARGRKAVAKILLDHGADPNAQAGHHGGTVLHRAVMNGDLALARLLLDRGADPNRQDWSGKTPLHHAVERNRDLVALILDHSPDLRIKSFDGLTALDMTQRSRKRVLIELFQRPQLHDPEKR